MYEIYSPDVEKKIEKEPEIYEMLLKEVLSETTEILNFDVFHESGESESDECKSCDCKAIVSYAKKSKAKEKLEKEIEKLEIQVKELEKENKGNQVYDLNLHIRDLEFHLSKIDKWTGYVVEYTIKDGEIIEPSKKINFGGEFAELKK